MFGEDVARKGGVYGVTRGLQRRIGPARVFDTLLDEQTILGLALGAGLSGLLPMPEIQYLAYLHNAEDQLRGEAATLPFFSAGQYRNPMVVRVAAYGYQKGFGGHFHNDNAVAVLRDIPGLVIASPSRPDDAAAMLRTCVAAGASTARCRCSSSRSRSTTGRPARGRRRPLGGALRRPDAWGDGARADRLGAHLRRRRRPHAGHLRQRCADEPAGGGASRHRGSASGWSTCAGSRRCRSRTCCARRRPRERARGGRDPAKRRRLRGRGHGAGRRRVRRPVAAYEPGQLRPARRRRADVLL